MKFQNGYVIRVFGSIAAAMIVPCSQALADNPKQPVHGAQPAHTAGGVTHSVGGGSLHSATSLRSSGTRPGTADGLRSVDGARPGGVRAATGTRPGVTRPEHSALNPERPGTTPDDPGRNHDDPGRNHDDPGRNHDDPGRGHDDPRRGPDEPERHAGVPEQGGYVHPGHFGPAPGRRIAGFHHYDAWGWHHGDPWVEDHAYWGGGFWGPVAVGAAFGAAVAIAVDSPGYLVFQNYSLVAVPCGPAGEVELYGPGGSVVCATPTALVPAGNYQIDLSTLEISVTAEE